MKESAVPLYELIPNKECIPKRWKLSTGTTNQDLAFVDSGSALLNLELSKSLVDVPIAGVKWVTVAL